MGSHLAAVPVALALSFAWIQAAPAGVSGFPSGPYTVDYDTGTVSPADPSGDASGFTGNGQGGTCTATGNFCTDAEVEGVYQWFVEDADTAYFAFSLNNTGVAGAISRAGFFTPFQTVDPNTGNFLSGLSIDLFEVTSSDDCFSAFSHGINSATCTGADTAWAYTSPLNDWSVDEVKNGDFPILGSSIFAVDFVGESDSSQDRIKVGESSAFVVRFQDTGNVAADFNTFSTLNFTEDGNGGGHYWCVRWQGQDADQRSDSACGKPTSQPGGGGVTAHEPMSVALFGIGLLILGGAARRRSRPRS